MVDSEHRMDLFLSFHGCERLSLGLTTRDLVRYLVIELNKRAESRTPSLHPSIFFDESVVRGQLTEDIFTAALQLRGGGLGLTILTPEFFEFPFCVTELMALLHVYTPRKNGIRLRFICLDCEPWDILRHPHVRKFVDTLRGHSLLKCQTGYHIMDTVNWLADLVFDVWNGVDGIGDRAPVMLGRTREESMKYMETVYFGDGGRDKKLEEKEKAIKAYHRKWEVSKEYPWDVGQIGQLISMFHNVRMEFKEIFRLRRLEYDQDEDEDDMEEEERADEKDGKTGEAEVIEGLETDDERNEDSRKESNDFRCADSSSGELNKDQTQRESNRDADDDDRMKDNDGDDDDDTKVKD